MERTASLLGLDCLNMCASCVSMHRDFMFVSCRPFGAQGTWHPGHTGYISTLFSLTKLCCTWYAGTVQIPTRCHGKSFHACFAQVTCWQTGLQAAAMTRLLRALGQQQTCMICKALRTPQYWRIWQKQKRSMTGQNRLLILSVSACRTL